MSDHLDLPAGMTTEQYADAHRAPWSALGRCNQTHAGARCTEPAGHAGDHRDVEPAGRTLARWPADQ